MDYEKLSEFYGLLADGKQLQSKYVHGEDTWHDFNPNFESFCFDLFEYRVKPESKIIPYDIDFEFLSAQDKHGKYLYADGKHYLPVCVDKFGVVLSDVEGTRFYNFAMLSTQFTWQDGTPCGKEVTE